MEQNTNILTQALDRPVLPGDESLFHDRHDGPFLRWMSEQGLSSDASDSVVMSAMQQYFETHKTSTISQLPPKLTK